MRIAQSQIQMASQSERTQATAVTQRLSLRAERAPAMAPAVAPQETPRDIAASSSAAPGAASASAEDTLGRGVRLLVRAVERFLGRALGLAIAEGAPAPEALEAPNAPAAAPGEEGGRRLSLPAGWTLSVQRSEFTHESEQTRFRAQGAVRTQDGREIRITLALDMQRVHEAGSTVTLRVGGAAPEPQPKDPLVINLDGHAVTLSDARIAFDLDADGTPDWLPFLGSGSGFLALDRNGNGVIDDGSELFGVHSGDGFADLAAFDEDGNGWIDENDSVFADLRIWRRADDGQQTLASLAAHGVGALYLGRAASPFGLRDGANAALADVISTGVFLHEDGRVGSLQQIDVYV